MSSMGKSMSTAKQINLSTAVKKIAERPTNRLEHNQRNVQNVQRVSSEPSADYLKKVNTIDQSFNDRLKQVYVTSINKNTSMDLPKDRPMPKDRTTPFALIASTPTADVKKPNFLSVNDLIELLSNHKENPEKWTFDYIASRFEISTDKAEKLVANYSTLQTYYAKGASKSDKYLHVQEPVDRIRPSTSVFEAEDILTKGIEKKWKTVDEVRKEWNDSREEWNDSREEWNDSREWNDEKK